jgi:crotonobetainyl-CoA:carnitine CoA-transferase CaiB-like acyl-CoA transferase
MDALYTILGERMRTRGTAEWRARLDAADVPNGVVNDMAAVVGDPGLNDSGFFHRYDHPTEGPCVTMRYPVDFSATPAGFHLPPPRLGEHTEALLSELGYSQAEIAEITSPSPGRPR